MPWLSIHISFWYEQFFAEIEFLLLLFSESNAIEAKYFPHTAQQRQIILPPSSNAKSSLGQSSHTGANVNLYFTVIATQVRDIPIFLKLDKSAG
jgi:hypothetical protein